MRTEEVMLELILNVARRDERIRAVCMNGSRVNAHVKKDIFQDYDIVYLVTNMNAFINDEKWIDVFGEQLIMQTPENMALFPPTLDGRFTYLMQFIDGNRIDLMLIPIEGAAEYLTEDSLTKILLDKDRRFAEIPVPSDRGYWINRPTPIFFNDCCNAFWWVTIYVAKGLRRKETLYALEHLHEHVRSELMRMLMWQVGVNHNFSVNPGKSGKFLEQYVAKADWVSLMKTYATSDDEAIWDALFVMCGLFRKTAVYVGAELGFTYDLAEDKRVLTYLQQLYRDRG